MAIAIEDDKVVVEITEFAQIQFVTGITDLDDLPDGTTYNRVLATELTSGKVSSLGLGAAPITVDSSGFTTVAVSTNPADSGWTANFQKIATQESGTVNANIGLLSGTEFGLYARKGGFGGTTWTDRKVDITSVGIQAIADGAIKLSQPKALKFISGGSIGNDDNIPIIIQTTGAYTYKSTSTGTGIQLFNEDEDCTLVLSANAVGKNSIIELAAEQNVTNNDGRWRLVGTDGLCRIDSFKTGTFLGVFTFTPRDAANINVGGLELQGGNLDMRDNVITTTDTDGNVTITPNGTGKVDLGTADIIFNSKAYTMPPDTGSNRYVLITDGFSSSEANLSWVPFSSVAAIDSEDVAYSSGSSGINQILEMVNGTIIETFTASVSESGGVLTLSLEKTGTGDVTMAFSDGFTVLDCTPPATIVITAGTDAVPETNYIYILQSTKVLTVSTSGWPTTEHIKISFMFCQSAATVATDGCLISQNWNDHTKGTNNQGHLSHITEYIRRASDGAHWTTGVAPTITIVPAAPDVVTVATTAGVLFQLHEHVFPAMDTAVSDFFKVVNDSVSAYAKSSDLADLLLDSTGASMTNSFFNLILWGSVNRTSAQSTIFINLPDGSYSALSDAELDVDKLDVFSLPIEFTEDSNVGFLIARFTFEHSTAGGGTWVLHSTSDLRGQSPQLAGASAGGAGIAAVVDDTTPELGGDLDVNGNNIVSASGDVIIIPATGQNVSVIGVGTSDIGFIVDNPSTTNTHASFLQLVVDSTARTAGGSWKVSLTELDHNLVFFNDTSVVDTFISRFSITPLGAGRFTTAVTTVNGFNVNNNEIFTGTSTSALISFILDSTSATGTLFHLKHDGNTSGISLHIETNNTNGSIIFIQTPGTTTGTVFNASPNALLGGAGVSISTSSVAFTGSLIKGTMSGNNAAVTGAAIFGSVSGASSLGIAGEFTSSGAGFVLDVNQNGSGGIAVFKDSTVAMLTIANAGAITCGTTSTFILPVRSSVADVQGTLFYDTDLNKLVFGTGSGFETVTSA